ncbi:MAG: regulatory protein TetR [Gemmatimonadetes bacterium]|nr:regulatory protein TetR [Gemmatimonadota bacterium]
MSVSLPATGPASDKREAILAAALRVIARMGLHDSAMSAIAREAGVAAGTLYLYFDGKDAMINALFLELVADQIRALDQGRADTTDAREGLWQAWHALARWHLEHPDASSVLHQCQTSAILTRETRDAQQRLNADNFAHFDDAVARGAIRDLSRPVFYALFAGPILALVQLREQGELDVTEEVLRIAFDGVCRSVLPADDAESDTGA